MSGVLLPICSIVFSLLLLFVYFSKERIDLVENKIYSIMLICSVIDSILVTTVHSIAIISGPEKHLFYIQLFNKIDFCCLIVFANCFLLYNVLINYSSLTDIIRKIKYPLIFSNVLFMLAIFFTDINVISQNGNFSIEGLSVTINYFICAIFIVASIVVTLINYKRITLRHIPVIATTCLIVLLFFIFSYNPYLVVVSISLTFINYVMYFTIENPDVKMIQELEVAREQADKANRAKTDFLSSMSHEIRTPLNAIVGFSDCIMDANTLDEAQENAKDIVNASQTLLEIVNGILDISKIEAGKIEIVNSKYNAPETFLELAKLITPKMNEKGLDFTYKIAPDLPQTLFGDHANLKKIVTNLLSNASKYTDKGFVHYEVNCINTKDVSKLIISVEDSGRGIKKESIDKMFTKFQRLDEDRNTTIEGTGLGLAITKQLIELMGGKIIVHTVYGEGSKFTVVLNQRIEKSTAQETKKVKTTLDLHNVRILLVDDTPLNLKVACKLLERYNANCLVTSDSGFDCVARIQRGEVYDLILLDDMMPKMSGVETLKKLKEIADFKTPVVALTANAVTGMREKYLSEGFDDYLAKPIEKEQLILVINQLLGRSVTEDIPIPSESVSNEAIRSEEIPNPEDYDKAEEERKKNGIIPVEDNIEDLLGDQVERNYKEKTISMNPIEVDTLPEIEQLEEEPQMVPKVDLIPVVDIQVPNSEEVYDRTYLEKNGADINHALELLGDMDMYNMTIHDFMNEVDEKWNRILEYKEKNDMPNYAIEVHSLKSDCKYLGFMSLADIAYEHELKSKDNDSDFVMNNFSRLEEEYHKVLEIARTYVEHNPIAE